MQQQMQQEMMMQQQQAEASQKNAQAMSEIAKPDTKAIMEESLAVAEEEGLV